MWRTEKFINERTVSRFQVLVVMACLLDLLIRPFPWWD
jgi:hypothetical protein